MTLELDIGIEQPAGKLRRFVKVDGRWTVEGADVPRGQDVCFCCGFPYCVRIPRAGLNGKRLLEVLT